MVDGVQWDVRALKLTLERSQEARNHLEQLGRQGVAYGEAHSPDAPPLRQGYVDGWVYTIGHDRDGLPVLSVANTDFKTWWIEKGTAPHQTWPGSHLVSTPPHHVLAHILDDLRS